MEKKLTIASNVAIILVSAVLVFTLVRNEFRARNSHTMQRPNAEELIGKAFPVSQPWNAYRQTVVLVLSVTCRYCAASGPFYQQLTQIAAERHVNVVALLPEPKSESVPFLSRLGLKIQSIQQADPWSVGVSGTPTLLLVDNSGIVRHVFRGQLQPTDQDKVILLIGRNALM